MQFSSVQSLSRVRLCATPWITPRQASLSITSSWSSLKLMSVESVMPSSYLTLCRPLLVLPIPPSIRVFSNESALRIRWPKYWSYSFSISPSNEHPGLISFRMDWLDLLTLITDGIPVELFQVLKDDAVKVLHSNCQHPLDHRKSKRVPEKHLFLLYWLCQSLWLCGSPQTLKNSERDGNTRPPDLPLRNLYAGQEAQLELDMEKQTGSK